MKNLAWVDSVITVIDVPLLKSTDESLMDRLKNYKTLAYPEIDRKRGFDEIINSPIYKNYVISEDGKTSGIVVYLKKDERLAEFIKLKDKYYNQSISQGLTKDEKINYKKFINEYEKYKNLYNKRNSQNISEIRDVINKYGENAKIHLGGIPMIADDMMSFIKSDIIVFGIGVLIFIILTLWFIFKNLKWVIMPLIRLHNLCGANDRFAWVFGMESYSDIFELYCSDVNFEYGYEYSYNRKISTI